MFTNSRMAGKKLRRGVRPVALVVSLGVSAFITGVALRSPDLHWLAWFSFLPLFVAVRSLRPMMAALAGGLWGACLYLFVSAGPTSAVDIVVPAAGPPVGMLGLLIVIPAVYLGLTAQPKRPLGFKLLTLALGWALVEVVLHPYIPHRPTDGLLAGSPAEAQQLHGLTRVFGNVCTAFLVACANASLLGIASRVRVSFPPLRSLGGPLNIVGRVVSQIVLAIQSWTLRQAHPRAPPWTATYE